MTGRTLDVTAARVDEISDAVCRGEMVGGHEAVQLLAYIRKIQRAITVDTRGRIDFGPEPVDPDRIAALLVDGKWVDAEVVRRAARHLGMVDQIIAQGQREEIERLKARYAWIDSGFGDLDFHREEAKHKGPKRGCKASYYWMRIGVKMVTGGRRLVKSDDAKDAEPVADGIHSPYFDDDWRG